MALRLHCNHSPYVGKYGTDVIEHHGNCVTEKSNCNNFLHAALKRFRCFSLQLTPKSKLTQGKRRGEAVGDADCRVDYTLLK